MHATNAVQNGLLIIDA